MSSSSSVRASHFTRRDGVVNVDVGSPGVTSVSAFRLIPGAAAAIAKLKVAGAWVCVVTNQTSVGKGLVSEEGLGAIHDRMRELLVEEGGAAAVVDAIFVATRTADTPCDKRKPAPGMLLEAMEAFGVGEKALVTMVGDAITDMQAAAAAGVADRVMVATGYGAGVLQAAARRASSGDTGAGVKTPLFIDAPEDDPSNTLPPDALPLVLYANLEEAVDAMLSC